jgi:hypothetical protein
LPHKCEALNSNPNTYEKNSLQILGIEEEEVQAKGIKNIFNKAIPENFTNIKKEMVIQGLGAWLK